MSPAAVSGTAAAATLGISPSTQDYGATSPGGTSGFIQFTVTNNGGAPSGVLATSLGGTNAAEFTIQADTCSGVTLAPAATCTVRVAFAPTSAGPKAASLNVTGAGGSVSAAVSGTA